MIEWTRNQAKRTTTSYQGKFALAILERFAMLDCHTEQTPIAKGHQYSVADSPAKDSKEQVKMAQVPYLKAIGSLMYLMLGTRPHLACSIGKLSRFSSNPGKKHWYGVKRVLQYLKGTTEQSLVLGSFCSGTPTLTAYSEASFKDCPDMSSSASGYIFYLSDGPISWSSKCQDVVIKSTMESKYLGLSNGARQAIWLQELLEDLGCTPEEPKWECCKVGRLYMPV